MKELINTTHEIAKNWWLSILIGILAIALGILFISKPLNSLLTLALLFAWGFIFSGILEAVFSITNRKNLKGWGWNLASGLVDLFIGIVLLSAPELTLFLMIYLVGFWIMFRSIWSIGSSIELQRSGAKGWGWLLLVSILGVIFSVVFLVSPAFGGTFIVSLASISFITYGIFRIYLGFVLKSVKNKLEE